MSPVAPITSTGSDPAFFSVWDMHSYYGESYIVQGVSFDIREGEIVALLGRNGAGKTSTLRSIARASDPEVLKRLNNDYIMLALYVDDKTKLPESEWYTSSYDQKIKKTIGKQNANLQIEKFNNNAQPFYILMNPSGELLIEPKSYDLSISNFITFLDAGKNKFAKGK